VLRDLAHKIFMELFDKVLLTIAKTQLDDYCPHRYTENTWNSDLTINMHA